MGGDCVFGIHAHCDALESRGGAVVGVGKLIQQFRNRGAFAQLKRGTALAQPVLQDSEGKICTCIMGKNTACKSSDAD